MVEELDKVITHEIPEHADAASRLRIVSAQRDASLSKAEIDAYLLTDWEADTDV